MPDLNNVIRFFNAMPEAPVQELVSDFLEAHEVRLFIKREDLLHPEVSGNKFRKLKYNLIEAARQGKETLVTFGGAYSNHIAAVAAAGHALNFKTIGFIRGDAHEILNSTLQKAMENGMQLHYLNRESYRFKNSPEFLEKLNREFPDGYILPEGGTNNLAIQGCAEMLDSLKQPFDLVCCAAGTGGTVAGLISSLNGAANLLAFSALKGGFLQSEIRNLVQQYNGRLYSNWQLQTEYHFGGYAKVKPELLQFIEEFEMQYAIPLEPVYTGKMLYGIFDLIKKNRFVPGTRILAIHTGGLQGLAGFRK